VRALHTTALVTAACGCNLVLTDYETSGGLDGGLGGDAAAPLEAEANASGVAVYRRGSFRLEADADSAWQWARWFYLPEDEGAEHPFGPQDHPKDQGVPITRSVCLWTAARANDSGVQLRSCHYSSIDEFGADFQGDPDLDGRALPVWYTVGGTVASVDSSIGFRTRVYASGLVWAWARVTATIARPSFDLAFGEISHQAADFEIPDANGNGLMRQSGGNAGVLVVAVDPQGATWKVGGDAGDAIGYFELEESLEELVAKTYVSAFYLGDKGTLAADQAARIADLQGGTVASQSGAALSHGGRRDPETGTFVLESDGGAEVTISLDAGAHFAPAFEVRGWTAATFAIRLDGELLATSSANGPQALAHLHDNAISFQYLGTVGAGAFTITPE
jgi:hypothetical protein